MIVQMRKLVYVPVEIPDLPDEIMKIFREHQLDVSTYVMSENTPGDEVSGYCELYVRWPQEIPTKVLEKLEACEAWGMVEDDSVSWFQADTLGGFDALVSWVKEMERHWPDVVNVNRANQTALSAEEILKND